MLGRKEESRKKKVNSMQEGSSNQSLTTTITTSDGQVITVSEFISRFDEAAKRRMEMMNKKLSDLELQMEAIEAEIRKANKKANSD